MAADLLGQEKCAGDIDRQHVFDIPPREMSIALLRRLTPALFTSTSMGRRLRARRRHGLDALLRAQVEVERQRLAPDPPRVRPTGACEVVRARRCHHDIEAVARER